MSADAMVFVATYGDWLVKWQPVGSRITCNPAPTDTDLDLLVLTKDMKAFVDRLELDAWEVSGQRYSRTEGITVDPDVQWDEAQFTALRSDDSDVNALVTDDEDFYDRFSLAAYVCRELNVMVKEHRILVHRAILYGERYEVAGDHAS